jgi:hypothetical protein
MFPYEGRIFARRVLHIDGKAFTMHLTASNVFIFVRPRVNRSPIRVCPVIEPVLDYLNR